MRARSLSKATWRRSLYRSAPSRRDRSSRRVSRAVRSAPAVTYCRGAFIGHLLEDSVDTLPDARADRGRREMLTPNEPSPDSVLDRLHLVLLGKRAFGDHV